MLVNLAATHMQGEGKMPAEENREDVAQRMTPAQITEGQAALTTESGKQAQGLLRFAPILSTPTTYLFS